MAENKSTELAILSQQAEGVATQISTIRTDMARISEENKTFAENIISKGQELLCRVDTEDMTDELDSEIATYIKEVKSVTKTMTDNRKGITQALDMVKKYFTTIESEVSVKNEDGVPFKLQKVRDEYARKKLEEERIREAERQRMAAISAAKVKLSGEAKTQCFLLLASAQQSAINYLNKIFSCVSLETKDNDKDIIEHFSTHIDISESLKDFTSDSVDVIGKIEAVQIINEAYESVKDEIANTYKENINLTKGDLLLKWDSKIAELEEARKAELERIRLQQEAEEARKKAEEAERIAREAKAEEERAKAEAEAARLAEERAKALAEQERIAREEAERKAAMEEADRIAREEAEKRLKEEAEIRQQQQEIDDAQAQAAALFEGMENQSVVKAKVKKVITITNRKGWIDILNFWWAHKAMTMTDEELEKRLGFAKRECEKIANKDDAFISSLNIRYDDDVTAK